MFYIFDRRMNLRASKPLPLAQALGYVVKLTKQIPGERLTIKPVGQTYA